MTDPAQTSGPQGDGSKNLARESKMGHAVQFVLTTLALGAAGWLANLDLSTVPGWLTATATAATTTAVGLLTSWATRNRPTIKTRYR
jgi:hypothetical protein